MSDYTPKTEEVRYNFATMEDEYATELNNAAFDRWLAQVKADAWAEGAIAVHKYFDSLDRVFSISNIPRNPYEKKQNA